MTDTARLYKGVEKTFEEAVEAAIALEGRRFSPLLTAWLRDKEVTERVSMPSRTATLPQLAYVAAPSHILPQTIA